MQKVLTPNIHILCTFTEHLAKMNIKASKQRNQFDLRGGGKREKTERKLFKSRSQLISVTSSVNYQVSGPLLQGSEKERK